MTLKYTRDFQIRLLINIFRDPKLYKDAMQWFRLPDFQLATCRLIFEVMRYHWKQFQQPVPFNVLALEIQNALRGASGMRYETTVQPLDYEAMAGTLGMLARCGTGIDESAYFRAEIPGFLRHVRLSNIDAQGADDADYRIQETMRINDEVSKIGTTSAVFEFAMDAIAEEENCGGRIGFGVNQVDRLINYGITRKMLGLLVACTGVGKTCGMINIALTAAIKGLASLFITMEMPSMRIKQRFQAMATMLEAGLFNKPKNLWPRDALMRLHYGNSQQFKFRHNLVVTDASEKATTVADIERLIMQWREAMNGLGYPDDFPAVVFLDWLERIDRSGLRGVTKTTPDSTALKILLEHVGEVARRQNVLIWNATQGTREAQTREILKITHTANSIHVHDPVDLSIGLAPVNPSATGADMIYVGDDDTWGMNGDLTEPICDRRLNASILKSRYSSAKNHYTSFYQGPTLRFWNNEKLASKSAEMAASSDHETMLRGMGATL